MKFVRTLKSLLLIVMLVIVYCVSCGHSDNLNRVNALHTVRAGETVWQIAEMYMPQQQKTRDIRELCYDIKVANDLNGHIQPGQRLIIPLWKK